MNLEKLLLLTFTLSTLFDLSHCLAGGHFTKIGEAPYHLQIRYNGNYACGGALIKTSDDNQIVLTSGKCVTEQTRNNLRDYKLMDVIGGRIRLNGVHGYEQTRKVTKLIRHPNWERRQGRLKNDLAILHLSSNFEENQIVQTIPLTLHTNKNPLGYLIITGWGQQKPKDQYPSEILKIAQIESVFNNECNDAYAYTDWGRIATNDLLCGGRVRNKKYQGPCLSDNGSPVTIVENYTLYLVGIYSFRYGDCGNRFQPALFADLSYYQNWISESSRSSRSAFAVEDDNDEPDKSVELSGKSFRDEWWRGDKR